MFWGKWGPISLPIPIFGYIFTEPTATPSLAQTLLLHWLHKLPAVCAELDNKRNSPKSHSIAIKITGLHGQRFCYWMARHKIAKKTARKNPLRLLQLKKSSDNNTFLQFFRAFCKSYRNGHTYTHTTINSSELWKLPPRVEGRVDLSRSFSDLSFGAWVGNAWKRTWDLRKIPTRNWRWRRRRRWRRGLTRSQRQQQLPSSASWFRAIDEWKRAPYNPLTVGKRDRVPTRETKHQQEGKKTHPNNRWENLHFGGCRHFELVRDRATNVEHAEGFGPEIRYTGCDTFLGWSWLFFSVYVCVCFGGLGKMENEIKMCVQGGG